MTAFAAAPPSSQYRVMGLIGVAHSSSHFFHLVVPALFPIMKDDLGVSYAELGLLSSLFFIASGICQPIAGFVVDRIGARPTLFVGLGLLAGGIFLCSLAPGYWWLVVLMPVAGIGNSVFHPADYSILGHSVERGRLGRAFGIHTLGGNLGWAAAPPLMLGLSAFVGWRGALMVAGGIGIAILLVLVTQRSLLEDGGVQRRETTAQTGKSDGFDVMVLLSLPIVLCFVYFLLLAVTQVGIQNFLPSILSNLDGTDLATGGAALTAFLLGSSAGTVIGMVLADRMDRHSTVVALGLAAASALLLVVADVRFDAAGIIATMALAGFALGFTLPSRDLVVRKATPPGATGRVFGFVYSGLDAGSAMTPVIIGLMLDHGLARETLWLSAAALVLAIVTALVISRVSERLAAE
jgi:predicted MFS family arabinose efflux permease